MAVTFYEYTGSPVYSGDGRKLSAIRQGEIDWSDIDALYLELFPAAVGGIPQLPALCPGSSVLRVSGVKFEPLFSDAQIASTTGTGIANPINQYDCCKVTVNYKTLSYDQANPSTDQILTRRVSIGGQFMTIPNTGLKWDDGDCADITNPDILAAKFIGTIDHEITFHRVPSIPWATLRSLIGKTNSAAFEGAAVETLLFEGVSLQQTVTAGGAEPWQMTCKFKERNVDGNNSITWNHFFDPDPNQGKWRKVVTQNGGAKVYPTGDFNNLL